jgi:hypothetical protein
MVDTSRTRMPPFLEKLSKRYAEEKCLHGCGKGQWRAGLVKYVSECMGRSEV